MTSLYARPWLQPNQFARNGKYPDALFQSELAALANHVLMFRQKEVVSFGGWTGALTSPTTGSRERWRTRYTPSPGVRAVSVRAWMAESEPVSLEEFEVFNPRAVVTITDSDPGTLGLGETDGGSAEFYFGAAADENSNPDHTSALWMPLRDNLDATMFFEPIQGREYEVLVTDVRSRILACTIYEVWVDGSTTPLRDAYSTTGPIQDADRQEILEAARAMCKRGAAPLFTWIVDDQASPRSTTSDTAKNLVDNTSTAVSGSTPGYTLDLRSRARVSTGTVSCRLAAYGSSSDTGYVRLKNSAGAIVATAEINSPTPGWFTGTCELPATLAKYDIHFDSTSGETTEVSAVHLEQWADGE